MWFLPFLMSHMNGMCLLECTRLFLTFRWEKTREEPPGWVYSFFGETLCVILFWFNIYKTSIKIVTIMTEIAWQQMVEIAWELLCDRRHADNFRAKMIQRKEQALIVIMWNVFFLVYSVCSSTGSKVITKYSVFFGRILCIFVCLFFFSVGLVLYDSPIRLFECE